MRIVDKIAVIMLSFLIALFGFAGIMCGVLSNTVASSKFMISVLENRHYYDSIYSEYCDDVESIAMPAGVKEGLFSSVVSKKEFKETINSIIVASYNESDSYAGDAFNKKAIYDRFYSCMTDYFTNEKGITITDEMTDSLDNVASLCSSTCGVYVTLPFIDTIGDYCTEFNRYFEICLIISAVAVIFLVVVLCITKKWRKDAPYLIGMALLTDGLMIAIAPITLILSGKIRYIQIEVESLYRFAIGYIEHLLYTLLTVGIFLIVLALIIGSVSFILSYKAKKKDT